MKMLRIIIKCKKKFTVLRITRNTSSISGLKECFQTESYCFSLSLSPFLLSRNLVYYYFSGIQSKTARSICLIASVFDKHFSTALKNDFLSCGYFLLVSKTIHLQRQHRKYVENEKNSPNFFSLSVYASFLNVI